MRLWKIRSFGDWGLNFCPALLLGNYPPNVEGRVFEVCIVMFSLWNIPFNVLLALMSTDRDVPNEEDDPEFDIPEDVENVFEELFAGVQDKVNIFYVTSTGVIQLTIWQDTTVRWSSAKGIACISERLPRSFVSQVLEQVLGLFGQSFSLGMAMTDLPSTAEAPWHGACLACAEMARRNLVPRQMLPGVLDWMMKVTNIAHLECSNLTISS